VDGVAEDRDQQRPRRRRDRYRIGPALRVDLLRDGPLPGLDLLEGQRPEFPSLEVGQDVELDQASASTAKQPFAPHVALGVNPPAQ
jgi:hypothetical protein